MFPPFLEITRKRSQGGEILSQSLRAGRAGRAWPPRQECLPRLGTIEGRRLGLSRLPLCIGSEFRSRWGTSTGSSPFLFCILPTTHVISLGCGREVPRAPSREDTLHPAVPAARGLLGELKCLLSELHSCRTDGGQRLEQ